MRLASLGAELVISAKSKAGEVVTQTEEEKALEIVAKAFVILHDEKVLMDGFRSFVVDLLPVEPKGAGKGGGGVSDQVVKKVGVVEGGGGGGGGGEVRAGTGEASTHSISPTLSPNTAFSVSASPIKETATTSPFFSLHE